MTWRNWGRSYRAEPVEVVRPRSSDDVVGIVERARESRIPVKPIGAGHSFSAIAVAPGTQLDMRELAGVIAVDGARARVTFGAGTRLFDIPALIDPFGLAFENLGDIDRQTIAGATQTGTHGTGLAFPSIGQRIVAATIVTGTGEVLRVSEEERAELLPAVRLGLGALGVLIDVTIQCVPAFTIEAHDASEPADLVLDAWRDRVESADHFELYWFPHTSTVVTKTQHRGHAERRPLSPVRRWVDDELLGNGAFRAMCAAGTLAPGAVPAMAAVAARAMGGRSVVDRSDRVFTTSRTVRFRELEYGMPLDAVPSAMRELELLIARRGWRISFPVEARAVAADDALLSTAHGRQTGYIAVHRYWREDPIEYFREAERIFLAHDGRPHWGKMHFLTARDFEARLPTFDAFRAVRDRLDPDRVLRNPYLERVLGA